MKTDTDAQTRVDTHAHKYTNTSVVRNGTHTLAHTSAEYGINREA